MGSSNSVGSGLTWTHACLTYLGSKGSARKPALKMPSRSLEPKPARTRLLLHTNSYPRKSFRPLLLSEIILPPVNLHQWRKRPRGNSEAEAEASPLGGSSGGTWHPRAREGIWRSPPTNAIWTPTTVNQRHRKPSSNSRRLATWVDVCSPNLYFLLS